MNIKLAATIMLFVAFLPLASPADPAGAHPGYARALTDLRDARWNLEHRPGDFALGTQEGMAISEIDRAIGEVTKVAREDEKNLHYRPRDDANLDPPSRLHHALEFLENAHDDLAKEEDNSEAREFKRRALTHVERAIDAARRAVRDIERNR